MARGEEGRESQTCVRARGGEALVCMRKARKARRAAEKRKMKSDRTSGLPLSFSLSFVSLSTMRPKRPTSTSLLDDDDDNGGSLELRVNEGYARRLEVRREGEKEERKTGRRLAVAAFPHGPPRPALSPTFPSAQQAARRAAPPPSQAPAPGGQAGSAGRPGGGPAERACGRRRRRDVFFLRRRVRRRRGRFRGRRRVPGCPGQTAA